MEFKQLEAFVNVVKYKSFSKAAEATFLTQPTISTHVSSLEKELGVVLIDRKTKDLRLTKQGRAFFSYAINILNIKERAINQMEEFEKELSGTLEIRTSGIPGEYILPKYISEFSKEYPKVSFNIEETDSEKVCSDILDNLGEIGFLGNFTDNGLKYEPILKDNIVVITPDNEKYRKLKAYSNKIRISDIKDEAFIFREEGSATRKTFENFVVLNYGMSKLNVKLTVNNIEALKKYVVEDVGISVLSKVSTKENEGYLIFDIEELDIERDFYMVYNKNTTLTPLAIKFKKFILGE